MKNRIKLISVDIMCLLKFANNVFGNPTTSCVIYAFLVRLPRSYVYKNLIYTGQFAVEIFYT